MTETDPFGPVPLAAELTIAWLGNQNNRVHADEVPIFLRKMHDTVRDLASAPSEGQRSVAEEETNTDYPPAVSVRKSLASRDHIISMIDGKPYRALRRHLTGHGLTPEEYRTRYNLKPDYPMVAESYSEARRAVARKIGLGAQGRGARASAKAREATSQASPKAATTGQSAKPASKSPAQPRRGARRGVAVSSPRGSK